MFRGGVQRTGLNRADLKLDVDSLDPQNPLKSLGSIQLRTACRSLLFSEGQIVALSVNGEVLAVDVLGDSLRECSRFALGGEVLAEAAIAGGLLFTAAGNSISAYALGREEDRMSALPYWQRQLSGPARHSLLAVGDWLYCMTDHGHGAELVAFSRIFSNAPTQASIYSAPHFSPLAGKISPLGSGAYFLGPENGGTLHEIKQSESGTLKTTQIFFDDLRGHAPRTPICVIGDTLFGIFGERKQVRRMRITQGKMMEKHGDDVEAFACADARTPILLSSNWISNTASGERGNLDPDESFRGSPVVVGKAAVAVGLNGGKVRLYDLQNPAHSRNWQVCENRAEITALISAGPLLIVGDDSGKITVARFP
jgi:hypothetical protein